MIEITKKVEKKFESFKNGEEKGFEFFFKEYYATLSYFAFKILKDQAIAEDVVSDSFIKLWERKEIIDKAGSLKSYLYTTVKNACIDILRNEKRNNAHKEYLSLTLEFSEESILHKMIEAEMIHYLMVAKKKLPFKTKRVFEMYYVEQKSYVEIAEELNISIHTAKNQKINAIKQLRKQFPYITLFLYFLEHGSK